MNETEINYRGIAYALVVAALLFAFLVCFMATAGCITAAKDTVTVILATPTPTPTPIPTPTATPTPTPKQPPVSLPTIKQQPVDPLIHGERSEGQWFKWYRPDVSGTKDLDAGVIAYQHAWLDNYTWYNPSLGQYFKQEPTKGNRYFVVWVHEELFGTNSTNDPGMYPFYDDAFRLQVKGNLIEADTVHNPVCRILELDHKYDYYNTITAPPFGWYIKQIGYSPETGGYAAIPIGEIRMGQGNAADGYILFEVPKNTMTEDVILLGNFARFGSAYWRFDD
jgi:hypothetical protein